MLKKIIISVLVLSLLLPGVCADEGARYTVLKDKLHVLAEELRGAGINADALSGLWLEVDTLQRENGRRFLGRYKITGYCTCARCCGKSDGITASGAIALVGRTVAMYKIPFGTRIYIDGIGERVVEDRGVPPGMVDVLCATHAECYAITGNYDVYEVINYE